MTPQLRFGAAFAALAVLFAVAIHSPPARSAVGSWAVDRIHSSTGIRATISRLDYNLLTLTFSASGVTLAAEGARTPFFSADELRLNLPWTFLRGPAIESLDAENPSLAIVREEDGTLNLPRSVDAATESVAGRIDVGRFHVRGLRVRYDDRPAGVLVTARDIGIALDRSTEGLLTGAMPAAVVSVAVGQQQTRVSSIGGRLAFDGRALTLENVLLEAPEGRVRVGGEMTLLPGFDVAELRYDGQLHLANVSPWIGIESAPTGTISFSGTAMGPIETMEATIEAAGERLDWSSVGPVSMTARTSVTRSAAAIESVRLAVAGGELTGSARLPFDESSTGSATLGWRNLHLGHLISAYGNAADRVPHFATVAEGSASMTWNGRAFLEGRGKVENNLAATPASRRDVPVSGGATLTFDGGVWQLTHAHRIGRAAELTGHSVGRIDPERLSSSTLTGRADLSVSDLSDAVELASQAGAALDSDTLSTLAGRARIIGDLAGTIGAPTANGTIELDDLRYNGTGPAVATSRYSASSSGVQLDDIQATLGANTVSGRLSIDIETRALRGELNGEWPDLALLAAEIPAEWRPSGSATLDARIAGTIDNPSVNAQIASDRLELAEQVVRQLRSTLHLANRVVTIDHLTMDQGDGTLAGTGTYALSTGHFSAGVKGSNLTLAPSTTLPVDATFDLQLSGGGTFAAPHADGFVQFSRLTYGGIDVGTARMDVESAGRELVLKGDAPELKTFVNARIAAAAPRTFTADISVEGARLQRLVPEPHSSAIALDGTIGLRLQAAGQLDALDDASAQLDLQGIDATVNGVAVTAAPARLRYSRDSLIADDLELRIGATRLVANGRMAPAVPAGEALQISLTGPIADLVPLARTTYVDALDASGDIDLRMQVTGRPRAPDISADVTIASATLVSSAMLPATGVNLRASYAAGLLDVRELGATWQGARISGTGRVPAAVLANRLPEWYAATLPAAREPARATLRVDSITPSVLSAFVPEGALADVAGRVDAVVSMTATSLDAESIEAEATLERAELSLAKVPLNQSRPTRLRLEDGRLQIVDWTWAGAGNRVNLAGGALLTGDAPVLDITADGTLDLRMLSAFSPDVATTGRATVDVKVTGLADQPLVDGRLSIENGALVMRAPRVAVNDVRGTVTFARDSLQLDEITASANGGTLTITGGLEYPKFTLSGGSIAIRGRGLALEVPDDLRSEIDADLQLTVSDQTPTLRGSVTILRGSYREPVSLAAQLLTDAETQVVMQPAPASPGLFDRVLLDIDVRTAEGVVVDNNYARLDMSANLRIVGTLDRPVPTGRVAIEEGGDVFLGGRTYDIVRGTVDFTSATRVEPTLDLSLQTRVQRYDITLEVSGTPETLRANLRSPGVSQAELVSLLLTGQRGDPTAIAQADVARGQLLMLLSGELLGFAGRAVGLDTVQLSHGLGAAASDFDLLATDTDPSARLTIGKHLSRDVEVVFSQALSESGDITWIAIYRPIQSIEVRGATQDDGSRSYEFRHEFSFGGRGSPAPRSEPAERPAERVTAITIGGTPGFDEEEIRRQLRLLQGERFDFYRWQQDRDRLLRFYHEREFLEARIAARRTPAPAGPDGRAGVALEYEIERGPETKLTIEGHPLPSASLDRMEEAWAWAVFDGFLLDDLASIAQESLTDEGYLRADVQTVVVSEPDAALKEIAVRIDPGTRFTNRRITFSGQQALSASALETLVRSTAAGAGPSTPRRADRAQSIETSMWHDPSVLQAAIEQQYRLRGYLDASVKVLAPVFSGESAELPVQISEGRQYIVGRVDVRGAQTRSQDEIVAAFGAAAGTPFQPATLEPSRRAVEVDYLRSGYNNVRVAVTPTIDATRNAVDLLLDIDEGLQQVLGDIDVRGADITRRSVIDRALDVEIGRPANQAEFFRAETRLYDTGAFRIADIALVPFETDETQRLERMRAEVTLQELPPYRFRYGFRVNDTITPTEIDRELRPALVVDLLRRNLFGHAISAGVAGQLEADRRLLRGVLSLPRFFGLPVTTSLFATRSREDFTPAGATPFVEDESGITAEQRFTLSPKMAVTYGYDFSQSHIFEPDPVPGIPPLELRAKVARLTGTYAWDRRNDPFAPQDGWFHSSGVELGTKTLGSDLRFVRYLAQQYYYRRVRRRLVLASAARLGFGRGFEQDLIPSERFYAGGGTTVRGFVEDGLGDVDFFGDPRGGNSMLILNQEARIFLFGWVHGVAFVDAGNVFPKASDFSFTNLDAGAGGGIRINSPFALLRIDFGVPLTSRRSQPSGRWYFGIGHAF
jgi:outer membrane protein assembly complex protein YaeT